MHLNISLSGDSFMSSTKDFPFAIGRCALRLSPIFGDSRINVTAAWSDFLGYRSTSLLGAVWGKHHELDHHTCSSPPYLSLELSTKPDHINCLDLKMLVTSGVAEWGWMSSWLLFHLLLPCFWLPHLFPRISNPFQIINLHNKPKGAKHTTRSPFFININGYRS